MFSCIDKYTWKCYIINTKYTWQKGVLNVDKEEILSKSRKENKLRCEERDWKLRYEGNYYSMFAMAVVWLLCSFIFPIDHLTFSVCGLMFSTVGLTASIYRLYKKSSAKSTILLMLLFAGLTICFLIATGYYGLYLPAQS